MTVNIPDKKLQLAPFDLHDGGFTFRNHAVKKPNFVKKSLTFLLSEQAEYFDQHKPEKMASSDLSNHKNPSLCRATGSEGKKIVIGMRLQKQT